MSMSRLRLSQSLLLVGTLAASCRTPNSGSETLQAPRPDEQAQDELPPVEATQPAAATPQLAVSTDLSPNVDMQAFANRTYLAFMKTRIKPAMDKLATQGYKVCDAAAIERMYQASDAKVKQKVNGAAFGGLANVQSIATQLQGQTVTLATLPGKIHQVSPNVDSYDVSTFIGLACGGGVTIKYADGNLGINVHYDVTEQKSGRSYGVAPARGANDASDKEYLDGLEAYVRSQQANLPAFYKTMFYSLLNDDGRGYTNVSQAGQAVLTDFLAVYTAEQARNLMDGDVRPHWDAALLEVTLLAAFHAGQPQIKMYYYNAGTQQQTFTSQVLPQTACHAPNQGAARGAKLRDYWQFSRNINDTTNCRRSGINVTKDEFRKLGKKLTAYVKDKNRPLYDKVKSAIGSDGNGNLFAALSTYLISNNTPSVIQGTQVETMAAAWTELLGYLTTNAGAITTSMGAG